MSAVHIIVAIAKAARKQDKDASVRLRINLRSGREIEGQLAHHDSYILALSASTSGLIYVAYEAIETVEPLWL